MRNNGFKKILTSMLLISLGIVSLLSYDEVGCYNALHGEINSEYIKTYELKALYRIEKSIQTQAAIQKKIFRRNILNGRYSIDRFWNYYFNSKQRKTI